MQINSLNSQYISTGSSISSRNKTDPKAQQLKELQQNEVQQQQMQYQKQIQKNQQLQQQIAMATGVGGNINLMA